VFAVLEGKLVTPSLDGILEGVTRRVVLDLARGLGLSATEARVLPEDLFRAEELFLTSTIRELVPVVRVDGQAIGNGKPGHWTGRLLEAFRGRAERGSRPR
jgi:branched-subunit amino acid aminotransferase/4-amino-4-deoxychorismate lyase